MYEIQIEIEKEIFTSINKNDFCISECEQEEDNNKNYMFNLIDKKDLLDLRTSQTRKVF